MDKINPNLQFKWNYNNAVSRQVIMKMWKTHLKGKPISKPTSNRNIFYGISDGWFYCNGVSHENYAENYYELDHNNEEAVKQMIRKDILPRFKLVAAGQESTAKEVLKELIEDEAFKVEDEFDSCEYPLQPPNNNPKLILQWFLDVLFEE